MVCRAILFRVHMAEPEKQTVKKGLRMGPSEIMYLIGLFAVFTGLWLWFGLGPALVADGGILVCTGMLNGWLMSKAEARNVI
jgi:hypothetical protein